MYNAKNLAMVSNFYGLSALKSIDKYLVFRL